MSEKIVEVILTSGRTGPAGVMPAGTTQRMTESAAKRLIEKNQAIMAPEKEPEPKEPSENREVATSRIATTVTKRSPRKKTTKKD